MTHCSAPMFKMAFVFLFRPSCRVAVSSLPLPAPSPRGRRVCASRRPRACGRWESGCAAGTALRPRGLGQGRRPGTPAGWGAKVASGWKQRFHSQGSAGACGHLFGQQGGRWRGQGWLLPKSASPGAHSGCPPDGVGSRVLGAHVLVSGAERRVFKFRRPCERPLSPPGKWAAQPHQGAGDLTFTN